MAARCTYSRIWLAVFAVLAGCLVTLMLLATGAGRAAAPANRSSAATAHAVSAQPPNDDRANAAVIAVPSTVRGTTVGATLESGEADSNCASTIRVCLVRDCGRA
jgi:hypothetical protein